MDKDYQNFVERMGSFEDTLDLSDTDDKDKIITHSDNSIDVGKKLVDKVILKIK